VETDSTEFSNTCAKAGLRGERIKGAGVAGWPVSGESCYQDACLLLCVVFFIEIQVFVLFLWRG
jgi:hypothetical protein